MDRKSIITLTVILSLVIVFISQDFLTKPRFRNEEGFKMQLARSFAESGEIRMKVEPDRFQEDVVVTNASNGWVFPVLLGTSFKVFSSSLFTARVVSGVFLLLFLVVVYLISGHLFGYRGSLFSTLLIATYAPFYAEGRAVMPEVPALFFLGLGVYLYLIFSKDKLWHWLLIALAIGLFAASKATFAVFLIPALFIFHLVEVLRKKEGVKSFLVFWLMLAFVVFPSFWLSILHPINIENIKETLNQVSKAAEGPCTICNIEQIKNLIFHSTTVHLIILFGFSTLASLLYLKKNYDWLILSILFYGIITFAYFLNSVGNFRYLLPLEVIVLAGLPMASFTFVKNLTFLNQNTLQKFVVGALTALVVLQGAHLLFFAKFTGGDSYIELEKFINEKIASNHSIGIVNTPIAGALVPQEHITQYFLNTESDLIHGVHPLDREESFPDFVIYDPKYYPEITVEPYQKKIEDNYDIIASFGSRIVVLGKK